MSAINMDDIWFRANPDREYRLRRQTPAELEKWPVPPGYGFTGWCIIRKSDRAMELFAIAAGETWDDYDFELGQFFAELRSAA